MWQFLDPSSLVQRSLTHANVEVPPDSKTKAAREISRLIFGGAHYRVEVGAAILDAKGIANTSELAAALRLSRQSVNQELGLLERAGLLTRSDGEGRKVYLRANPSPYWELCAQLRDEGRQMLLRNRRF